MPHPALDHVHTDAQVVMALLERIASVETASDTTADLIAVDDIVFAAMTRMRSVIDELATHRCADNYPGAQLKLTLADVNFALTEAGGGAEVVVGFAVAEDAARRWVADGRLLSNADTSRRALVISGATVLS